MTTEPRVAVLLLNWNGWKDTLECLESLFRMAYGNFFVVLCDNASTDGSIDRIRRWCAEPDRAISMRELDRAAVAAGAPLPREARIAVIHNGENLGFAAGNNVGLEFLRDRLAADYVWILNNDVIVASDSLSEMVRCAQSESAVGGVGATIFEYGEPTVVQAAGGGVFSRLHINPRLVTRPTGSRAGGRAPTVDFISGACMLVPMPALLAGDLIDESFFIYCEDVDFCVRIRARGLRMVHAEAAHIWHKGGGSIGHRSLRHDYYTVRNTLAVVQKHYPEMTPVIAGYLVYRTLLPKVLRWQLDRLRVVFRGFRDYRRRITGPVSL